MIANLPLLFTNGYPVALSKITTSELEKFITFMVTCSWGHDTAKDILRPPWWPKNVAFSHPFVRPSVVPQDWESRLKNLVRRCYDYHKSAFLLVFSAQLSRYPRKRVRFVDNHDHTTSLYYKPSGRLLVTFRNENMLYDSKSISSDEEEPQIKSTDIYLCDNCDSHFDNLDILTAHERLCNNEIPSSTCNGGLPDFLSALKLQPVGVKTEKPHIVNDWKPKNVRNAASIDRGPLYPFSSLAYTRNIKTNIQRDTSYSRERVERYCCNNTLPSKILSNKNRTQQFPVRYRRPIDYWHRKHVFPNQRYKNIIDLKAQLLLLKCRPITVKIHRMSLGSIQEYIETLQKESEMKMKQLENKDVVYVDGIEFEQPTDAEMRSADPLNRCESECEVIDLCSDDDSSVNENCDPRAGVACVMRGGAVLRRTAATGQTPLSLPSEPCGARQRPLPITHNVVLQPHPVILITHHLNNLQTISLE